MRVHVFVRRYPERGLKAHRILSGALDEIGVDEPERGHRRRVFQLDRGAHVERKPRCVKDQHTIDADRMAVMAPS